MSQAAVAEFPFVEGLPKREKSKLAKLWDHFREVKAVTEQHGFLMPQRYAADLLGISRQRVHTLVKEGRLVSVVLLGVPYVTEASMMEYAQAERTGGRPPKAPSVGKIFSGAYDAIRHPEKS